MKISKKLQERIDRAVKEKIDIVPYNPSWPKKFQEEKDFLLAKFPQIIRRVEHFGSTAVPGLASKPIVDMLIEILSHKAVVENILPILTSLGYDYFYRPELDELKPPYYDWFIKRNSNGKRTHHLHMVKKGSKLWERLKFRDYLRAHPEATKEYGDLKSELSNKYPNDREAYTKAKTAFISEVMRKTKS